MNYQETARRKVARFGDAKIFQAFWTAQEMRRPTPFVGGLLNSLVNNSLPSGLSLCFRNNVLSSMSQKIWIKLIWKRCSARTNLSTRRVCFECYGLSNESAPPLLRFQFESLKLVCSLKFLCLNSNAIQPEYKGSRRKVQGKQDSGYRSLGQALGRSEPGHSDDRKISSEDQPKFEYV